MGDVPLSGSLCARTASQGRPLTINDAYSDALSAGLPAVAAGLVGSFLGVPIRADDGQVVGAMCVVDAAPRLWTQDEVSVVQALAESAATELELAALARDFDASRARWDLAIEAAGAGSFDWDLRTGRLSWDRTLIDLFGYGDDDRFDESIDAFNARLHPDDVSGVAEALQRAIDTVGAYEAEYRVVLPGGTVRQVQARGRAIGRDGVSDRLLGAAWDVSVTRGAEDRAARIVEAMPVAYLRLDADGSVLTANRLAERLLTADRLALAGRALRRAVPGPVGGQLDAVCQRVIATGEPETLDMGLDTSSNVWLELRVWPDPPGVSIFFTDITQRVVERAAAERSAAHDRAVAEALQNALLTTLPSRDHLEFVARYVTAAVGDSVGGDWYDTILQPGGATTVVVGDVAGHDIAAAASMGQLRSMLRAFLWQSDDPPAAVTSQLDRAILDLYPGVTATMIAARLEQDPAQRRRDARTLRWTNAGNLPPVIIDPDGSTRLAEAAPDLLLGVDSHRARHDHITELAAGSILVLYTDGLIERRGEDIDVGLARLRAVLQRHHHLPTADMVDAVLAELHHPGLDDDVVVLAVRLHREND